MDLYSVGVWCVVVGVEVFVGRADVGKLWGRGGGGQGGWFSRGAAELKDLNGASAKYCSFETLKYTTVVHRYNSSTPR